MDISELLYRVCKHSLLLPCHQKETERIVRKNMRMGIGVSGYLQASEEQKTWLSDGYEYLREFDKVYSDEHGMNSSVKLTTVKPSGCSVGETLIPTEAGFLMLEELGDVNGEQWQSLNLDVLQEQDTTIATKFYNNGEADTIIISTDGGPDLESTPQHKYRVITDTGKYIWKRMDELEIGDMLPYRVGGYTGGRYQDLGKIEKFPGRASRKDIRQPQVMCERLSYFLGAYLADGNNESDGIRIAGNDLSKMKNMEYLKKLALELFDIEAIFYLKPNTHELSLRINSKSLLDWLAFNHLLKEKTAFVEIPLTIRMSPKVVLEQFIEGYFNGDGHFEQDNTKSITTVSKIMAQQLTVVLRAIGVDVRMRKREPGPNNKLMLYVIQEQKGRKGDTRYARKATRSCWEYLSSVGLTDFNFDTVNKISYSKNKTYDIEVPYNNCYISNSYVSHNTLSLLPGITSGCHPAYAQFMYRRIRIASSHELVDLCRKSGYPVEPIKNFDGTLDHGTVVVTFPFKYPEGTILAKDMTAIEQLKQIKRLQKDWSDNSVSCTIYFTPEELPEIKRYLEVYYKTCHKSLSFMLRNDHGFLQAPYEEITEEQYNDLVSKTIPITSIKQEMMFDDNDSDCVGGSCPIR